MPKVHCILLFAAVLVLATLPGCGSEGGPTQSSSPLTEAGRSHYREHGFSVKFPEKWEKKAGYGLSSTINVVAIASSPLDSPTDEFRERVSVTAEKLPSPMSLEDFAFHATIFFGGFFPDYNGYSQFSLPGGFSRERIPASNYTAIKDSFQSRERIPGRVEYSSGTPIYFDRVLYGETYFLLNGSSGYAIVCISTIRDFSKYRLTFEEVVKSFRFE